MRVERLEFGAYLHVLVGPDVVGAPDFLAGSLVEGGDPSAHSHFAAARTDDHFSLHDYRRHGDRLAAREITHLGPPDLIPCCRVDSDGVSVQQVVENLSVGVCGAAIHDITAGLPDRL